MNMQADYINCDTYIICIILHLGASVEENTIPSQPLLTVTASDADSIETGFGAVTYSIKDADGSFIINDMGEILVNRSLDREVS